MRPSINRLSDSQTGSSAERLRRWPRRGASFLSVKQRRGSSADCRKHASRILELGILASRPSTWPSPASVLGSGHAATYHPRHGARFLTRDPLAATTQEPHAYAANNPANWTDPTGLEVENPCGEGYSYSRSNGCQPSGASTHMHVTPHTSRSPAPSPHSSHSPSNPGIRASDPGTYPGGDVDNPYLDTLGLGTIARTTLGAVITFAKAIGACAAAAGPSAVAGGAAGAYVGRPDAGALVGGVSGCVSAAAFELLSDFCDWDPFAPNPFSG